MQIVEEYASPPGRQKPVQDAKEAEILGIIQANLRDSLNDITQNQLPVWLKLERAYRKVFDAVDQERLSERSKFITHVTQEAVDEAVAELTEAAFGANRLFNLEDNFGDNERVDVEKLANSLHDKIAGLDNQLQVEQVAFMGELYGTGIGEVVPVKIKKYTPTQRNGQFGVVTEDAWDIKVKAIKPHNFRIQVGATSIASADWCAVEDNYSTMKFKANVKAGTFKDVMLDADAGPYQDETTRSDSLFYQHTPGFVLLCRWYGKLPARLLRNTDSDEPVEAVVYVVNREAVVRAVENPFMCKDRAFASYRPQTIPGAFWGIGIGHKVSQHQVGADRHTRTHDDALGMTAYPVMGTDATRIPKGLKFTMKPGANIMVNGRPSEIMERIDFGQPQSLSLETASRMIEWSKSAGGIAGIQNLSGMMDAKAGSLALALGPILKRTKKRLRQFTIEFFQTVMRTSLLRLMQFDPKNFPATDLTFKFIGVLGMAEREFEQGKYLNMLQTLGPDSPIVPRLLASIMRMSSVEDKEEVAAMMIELAKEKQIQQTQDTSDQVMKQVTLRKAAADAGYAEGRAIREVAEAQLARVEAELAPERIKADIFKAMVMNSNPQQPDDQEFEQRYKAMQLILNAMQVDEKAKDRESNERISLAQMKTAVDPAKASDEDFAAALESLLKPQGA